MIKKTISIVVVMVLCITSVLSSMGEEREDSNEDYVQAFITAINNMQVVDGYCPGKAGIANCVETLLKSESPNKMAEVMENAIIINFIDRYDYPREFHSIVKVYIKIIQKLAQSMVIHKKYSEQYDLHEFKNHLSLGDDSNVTRSFYDALNSLQFNKELKVLVSTPKWFENIKEIDNIFNELYLLSTKEINVIRHNTITDELSIDNEKLKMYNDEIKLLVEEGKDNIDALNLAINAFVNYYNRALPKNKEAIMFLLTKYHLVYDYLPTESDKSDTPIREMKIDIDGCLENINTNLDSILLEATKANADRKKLNDRTLDLMDSLNNTISNIKSSNKAKNALEVINNTIETVVKIETLNAYFRQYGNSSIACESSLDSEITKKFIETFIVSKELISMIDDGLYCKQIASKLIKNIKYIESRNTIEKEINEIAKIALHTVGVEKINSSDIIIETNAEIAEISKANLIEKAKIIRKSEVELQKELDKGNLSNDTIKKQLTVKIPQIENCENIEVVLPALTQIFSYVDIVQVSTELLNFNIYKDTFMKDILNKKITLRIKKLENGLVEVNVNNDGNMNDQIKEPTKLGIPYRLNENEDPMSMVVYSYDENGNIEMLGSKYNKSDSSFEFSTDKLNKYYVKKTKKTFEDIEESKYKRQIEVVAGRGILDGKDENKFDPEGTMSLGEFINLIAQWVEIKNNVKDKVNDDNKYYQIKNNLEHYTVPLQDGHIKKDAVMTRRQMVKIVLDFIDDGSYCRFGLKQYHIYDDFDDNCYGDSYLLKQLGIMDLRSGGLIANESNAKRSEIAYVMYNLYKLF